MLKGEIHSKSRWVCGLGWMATTALVRALAVAAVIAIKLTRQYYIMRGQILIAPRILHYHEKLILSLYYDIPNFVRTFIFPN